MQNSIDNVNIVRRLDESEDEYKLRLYSSKDLYDLTWEEIADIMNSTFGYNYSESKYRKEASKILNKDEDVDFIKQVIDEDNESIDIDEMLFEIKKEKVKASDERVQANAIIRRVARDEVFKDIALEAVREMSKDKILDIPDKITYEEETSKCGVLCIGDWHYGLDVDLFFNKYNPEIAVRRVGNLTCQALDIINEHDINELIVVNLGDMISGRIHLPLRLNSRIDAVTQTMEVSELIAEMLTKLSNRLPVKYISVEDNHSRVEPHKKESINTEAFSRVIDWYLEERLKNNPNISFLDNKIGPDIASFKVFNHSFIAVHGDRDPQRGIVDRLNSYIQDHIDVIISAHLHHFSADENNETEFYCNGSLIGQDQYANDLRLNSRPSQLMFVSTHSNPTKVLYKIKL